jgi:Ca2+-binding EF-hand superfamily protein
VQRYVERIISIYDTNEDGRLDESEWDSMRGAPESIDADRDGLVTASEFVQHVTRFSARRRIHLVSPEPAAVDEEAPLLQPISAPPARGAAAAKPAPGGVGGSGENTSNGVGSAASPPAASARRVNRRQDLKFFVPASRLPGNLPSWFHSQDRDGDGQITLAEYAPTVTNATIAEFRRYDRNGDGLITADECARRTKGARPSSATRTQTGNGSGKNRRK